MAKAETTGKSCVDNVLNVEFMRSLVKQYSELGQWTSALFWADAAAASSGDVATGDDIWLLASAMLARGELHRAAHAVTSRELHRQHLLCLGVVMRAFLAAKEPTTALELLQECDSILLEPRPVDQTHNRALAGVLVSQARALTALERREAAADALISALRADCACYEALDLLLEQHLLTPKQERELIDSMAFKTQLSPVEAALVRAAYRARLQRYGRPNTPAPQEQDDDSAAAALAESARSRTLEAALCRARALAAQARWAAALAELDADQWACADVRAACLLELKKTTQLFAFAHSLVDAYPQNWTAWFAVGCYYYLIGKSDLARRYLSKAKSLEPSAGCVWLAYGHSFAADNEHDQAMAAYFKASQLMSGSHLPLLYVGVECSLLNNVAMCGRFLLRAAQLHEGGDEIEGDGAKEGGDAGEAGQGSDVWERVCRATRDPHVAHEAGAAAYNAGHYAAARALFMRALESQPEECQSAATLDALGHACRKLGHVEEALSWHGAALARRPGRGASLAARGLCLALLGREHDAAHALHAALAARPDDAVAAALLDAVVDDLDAATALTEEEIPQFPFPRVQLSLPSTPAACGAPSGDVTNTSDMSMSFE